MSRSFAGWEAVGRNLQEIAAGHAIELNAGQRASLVAIAERLPGNGVLIADEVGLGKTRIAAAVARGVIDAGGRVAIIVPPVLGYQWREELQRKAHIENTPLIIRSLDAYLDAWKQGAGADEPWGDHPALLISHAFCNWSIKSNTKTNWKWALLPATLALARARSAGSGRLPRGYWAGGKMDDDRIAAAAQWIFRNADKALLDALASKPELNRWGSESPLFDPGNYLKRTVFRSALEQVVGLGLGRFDLVIIDEAHKSRGEESNLNRLLDFVVQPGTDARRLAMTATPIELDAKQWTSTLQRLGTDLPDAPRVIDAYAAAVEQVRASPTDPETRAAFGRAAQSFKNTFGAVLVRRDKRDDPWVRRFAELSGESHHAYRRERAIAIDAASLPPAWRQAVCAAEALSFATRGSDDAVAKRLRLTLGNGHGIAALMDQLLQDAEEDKAQAEADGAGPVEAADPVIAAPRNKREQRADWWKQRMADAFREGATPSSDAALYEHPAISAAVEAIEATCGPAANEKVLVFGRFTRPMRSLVRLLNARALLRSLDSGVLWPQEKLADTERAAVLAALRQSGRRDSLDDIDSRLKTQYAALEQQRETFRTHLVASIAQGFGSIEVGHRIRSIYEAFAERVEHEAGRETPRHAGVLALVARAIQDLMGHGDAAVDAGRIAAAFVELVDAASDQEDRSDAEGQGGQAQAVQRWEALEERLRGEFNLAEGAFARLMHGDTRPHTRRMLQLAFNREHSHPKVLVVQSVVGREGLNLHTACRTVVLLHPEWNPGVVEQQIGRVDRIGSLWQSKFQAWEKADPDLAGDGPPRIEIRPVVFKGSYDEENWRVLRERWEELRAQLHGVVINEHASDELMRQLAREINALAPDFSPAPVRPAR